MFVGDIIILRVGGHGQEPKGDLHVLQIGIHGATGKELAEIGLLNESRDTRRRGRKVQIYRKSSWEELTDAAKSEAERLQIPRSVFE